MDAGANFNLGVAWMEVLTLIWHCVDAGANFNLGVAWMELLTLIWHCVDAGANFNLGVVWMEVLTLIWHCVDAGGPIGGCQLGGRDTYSLGYIQSKPHVADDGTITLRYVGGTICHRGKPQQAHRSMRINFFCSRVEVSAFMGVWVWRGGGGGVGGERKEHFCS